MPVRRRPPPPDEDLIEIIFQDATAADRSLNTPPSDPLKAYRRHLALPPRIRFICHVKTWEMGTVLPVEMRRNVRSLPTFTEVGTLNVGRFKLKASDVIGLGAHPGGAIEGAGKIAPTLVVHVPSGLNPGYSDARVEFGPKTNSWMHQPARSVGVSGRRSSLPRVIVPLHLESSHPAKALTAGRHQTHRTSARAGGATSTRELGVSRAGEEQAMDSQGRVVHAEKGGRVICAAEQQKTCNKRPSSQWTEGWLPFPYHGRC